MLPFFRISWWKLLAGDERSYWCWLSSVLSSWFVTMQICAVSFQSWRNVFGLLLRELRPWRLHWGMQKRVPWWTAAATSKRSIVSKRPWGQRMLYGAHMRHKLVPLWPKHSTRHVFKCLHFVNIHVLRNLLRHFLSLYHPDSKASEAKAAACVLSHKPFLHVHPCHWTRQHLQQRSLPGQHCPSELRKCQLQPQLSPEQLVSLKLFFHTYHMCQNETYRSSINLIRPGFQYAEW